MARRVRQEAARGGCAVRAARGLSLAYAAAAFGAWALGQIVAERHWIAALVTYAPQWPWVAAGLAVGVFGLAVRDGRAAGVALGCAVAYFVVAMGFTLGRGTVPRSGSTLKVMTYNIHGGRAGLDGIATAILDQKPDVACLQEAETPGGGADLQAKLRSMLDGYECVGQGSFMLASRHPVGNMRFATLSPELAFRPAHVASLTVRGRSVTVMGVHFASAAPGRSLFKRGEGIPAYVRRSARVRTEQADVLLKLVRRTQGPVIVCGDFNTPPRGLVYGRMASRLTDAFAASGFGFGYTYSSSWPMLRIDYIWLGGGARPVSARSVPVKASDHRPVVAEVSIR